MSHVGGRYDRSFADLMAGVAVVFLLLAAIFIRKANQQREEAQREREAAVKKVDQVDLEAKAVRESLGGLHDKLAAMNQAMDGGFLELSALDAGVNALEIEFADLSFDPGRCDPPEKKERKLREGAVRLLNTICGTVDEMRDAGAMATISLEGHTDAQRFSQPSRECGVVSVAEDLRFNNNVRLSAARAQQVFFALRDELGKEDAGAELRCLDDNFVVSGRGEAALKNKIDREAPENRRLVIRVRGDLRLQ
jgi:hypothetical protein